MEYNKFGRTGWEISRIGFGGWQLGGTWGNVDRKESIRTLLYAFENGINFVDTAFAYGNGQSENIIGKALNEHQGGQRIYVTTKVTPLFTSADKLNPDDDLAMRGRYPSWYLREMVEGSLHRLGLEVIDLLQLHFWIPKGFTELDWLETLNELREEGKIDRIGVSLANIRPNQGLSLARYGLVDSIQVLFNMFEQEPAAELFPFAKDSGTAIISRVPFDSGALTGTWNMDTYSQWSKDDKRHLMYRDGRFQETLDRVERLKELVKPYFQSLAEAAIKYVLAHEAVSVVIPGMRNEKEVNMNVNATKGDSFPEELLEPMKCHSWKHEFYY